jgi:phage shock protein A
MSLWKRFVRAVKSLFGGAISSIEDPKLILEQNIRELNEQVPKMNDAVATAKAQVNLFKKEYDKKKAEHDDLVIKIKAAISQNREDIASQYALKLEQAKSSLSTIEAQLAAATKAYEKAVEVKKAFMKEKDKKINEAKEALKAHERSKWMEKIANTMQSFETMSVAETHEEMITKLNEKTAKSEAKLEMALDTIDTSGLKMEEEMEKIKAAELLKQFKLEMQGTNSTTTTTSTTDTTQVNSDILQNKDKTL